MAGSPSGGWGPRARDPRVQLTLLADGTAAAAGAADAPRRAPRAEGPWWGRQNGGTPGGRDESMVGRDG